MGRKFRVLIWAGLFARTPVDSLGPPLGVLRVSSFVRSPLGGGYKGRKVWVLNILPPGLELFPLWGATVGNF